MNGWKGYYPMKSQRIKLVYLIAFLILAAAIFGSLCLGAAHLSMTDLWEAIRYGAENGTSGTIFYLVRLPRTIACLLAGAGLAVSGAVIQAVLANQLASPGIIGVNAGAGLAVTLCCAFGTMGGWMIAGASFVGALTAVFLVTFTAQKMKASRTTVILGGVAVNSFLSAVSEAVTTLIPEAGVMSSDFRVGGFSAVSHLRLIPAGICIILALIVVFTLCNEIDLMNLGEETAQSLGMPVRRVRTLLLVLAALLAGASVSFAGILGFVGLIVPHMLRRLVGSESRCLIPLCAVGGAAFVTLCDLLSRLLFMPYEVPVGILMSVLGGPFFVWLLLKKKGGHVYA